MRSCGLGEMLPAALKRFKRLAVIVVTGEFLFQLGQRADPLYGAARELHGAREDDAAGDGHRSDQPLDRLHPGRQWFQRIAESETTLAGHDFPLFQPRSSEHGAAGVTQIDDQHTAPGEHHMLQMDFTIETIINHHILEPLAAEATEHALRSRPEPATQPHEQIDRQPKPEHAARGRQHLLRREWIHGTSLMTGRRGDRWGEWNCNGMTPLRQGAGMPSRRIRRDCLKLSALNIARPVQMQPKVIAWARVNGSS